MIYKSAITIISAIFIMAFATIEPSKLDKDSSVVSVLEQLGDDYSDKKPNFSIDGVSAEVGQSIVNNGFSSKPSGGKSSKQSNHFVCTSCHNTQREDPDLTVSDPMSRLEYVAEHELPFLQGTTLFGAVNRDTYYNGDYYLKYEELVDGARNDIRGAIQLCATECAQGRALKDWEIESVLAYLWTIDLKMNDLSLTDTELAEIESAIGLDGDKKSASQLIKSKYLQGSPATFVAPPEDRKLGNGLEGDTRMGQLLYESSCLHCHENGRYSYFYMDDHAITHRYLNRKADGYGRQSLYQVTRYGVYPKSGKRSYMPQYPLEKMSEQQLADLRAYIRERAE